MPKSPETEFEDSYLIEDIKETAEILQLIKRVLPMYAQQTSRVEFAERLRLVLETGMKENLRNSVKEARNRGVSPKAIVATILRGNIAGERLVAECIFRHSKGESISEVFQSTIESRERKTKKREVEPTTKKFKILWVDSMADYLEHLREQLEKQVGARIKFLKKGGKVLQILEKAAEKDTLPDIVISDIYIEEISGLGLAKDIRNHPDQRINSLSIYLFSVGSLTEEERNKASELGAAIVERVNITEELKRICETHKAENEKTVGQSKATT